MKLLNTTLDIKIETLTPYICECKCESYFKNIIRNFKYKYKLKYKCNYKFINIDSSVNLNFKPTSQLEI